MSEDSALRRQTSAVKTATNSTGGYYPGWNIQPPAKNVNSGETKTSIGDVSKALTNTPNVNTKPSSVNDGVKLDTTPGTFQPIGYKFNLPPHQWSLPIRPQRVNKLSATYNVNEFTGMSEDAIKIATASAGSYLLKDDPNNRLSTSEKDIKAFHGFRRARIWTFKNTDYSFGATQEQTTTNPFAFLGNNSGIYGQAYAQQYICLLYTSPSPRDS